MKFQGARLWIALGVLALLPASAWALHLSAPPAGVPELTAFAPGEGNLTDWAQETNTQYVLRSMVSGVHLAADLDDQQGSLVVIHAPSRVPLAYESRILHGHLDAGGSVLVMDPEGVYNDWLNSYGIAVAPPRILDPGIEESPIFVALSGGSSQRVFNPVVAHAPASLIQDDEGLWEPWLHTSVSAHLDLLGTGSVDRGDPPGPHLVGAARTVASGGTLIVMGDASILSDGLREWEGSENREFARWLMRQALPQGGLVVIDESQNGWTDAERLPVQSIRTAAFLQGLPVWASGGLVMVLVSGAIVGVKLTRPLKPYLPHERHEVERKPEGEGGPLPRDTVEDVAWRLLSQQSKQPVHRLKRMDRSQVVQGLCEDRRVAQVLLGHASEKEMMELMEVYAGTQVVAESPGNRKSGVEENRGSNGPAKSSGGKIR